MMIRLISKRVACIPRHVSVVKSRSINSMTEKNSYYERHKQTNDSSRVLQPKYSGVCRVIKANSSGAASQQQQSTNEKNELVTNEAGDDANMVEEEEFLLANFGNQELVPEVPIKSLDLVKNIEKVEKKGSFSVDIFTGRYDTDFLQYPEILDNRNQNLQLKDQATMVRQMFPQIWDDLRQLQKFNFFNLFQLSVSEMMIIFESIGQSSRKCYSASQPSADSQQYSAPLQTQVSRAIINLIIRNCLTYWPIYNSQNNYAKEFIPQSHILYGGLCDAKELVLPIGFGWTEQAENLGSVPPQEWLTYGQLGDTDVDHFVLNGKKTRVLYDESVENYLIYYRDKFLAEEYERNTPADEANPASDPFVGCCLVPKSLVKESAVYYDSAGCQYVDIEFDQLIPKKNLVFAAQRKDANAVNIKALGQLATCSVVLGILKDSVRMTYKHLIDNKKGILNCDIIARKLAAVTGKIFAVESMLYYIAGMYDGLKEGFDAHMETTILKIVTNEYAYEVLRELQHICSSDMFIISKLQDQVNIFDSFLDGNIYNRLYLSTMGIIWFARSNNTHLNKLRLLPWYPGYFVKNMMRERSERGDYLTIQADFYGSLHPSLKDAAINLEYIVKRVKYATETIIMRHGKDATAAQSALYKLAQLSIDSFILTTMCARASKSYCNGSRLAELDVAITTTFSRDLVKDVRLYMDDINTIPINAFDNRAAFINDFNIKYGGYYAESPLDPNM